MSLFWARSIANSRASEGLAYKVTSQCSIMKGCIVARALSNVRKVDDLRQASNRSSMLDRSPHNSSFGPSVP